MKSIVLAAIFFTSSFGIGNSTPVDLDYREFTYFDYSYSVANKGFSVDPFSSDPSSSVTQFDYSDSLWTHMFLGFWIEGFVDRPLKGKSVTITSAKFDATSDGDFLDGLYLYSSDLGVENYYSSYAHVAFSFDDNQDIVAWAGYSIFGDPSISSSYEEISSTPLTAYGLEYFDRVGDDIYDGFLVNPGKWTQKLTHFCALFDSSGYFNNETECQSVPPLAPVPVPAGLPLLFAAISGLVSVRKLRSGKPV
jgi:hypothetical protein